MAAISSLKLEVIYGSQKHKFELCLPTKETGNALTVHHLQEKVQQLTEVPAENQKLIFKGKSLTGPGTSLSEFGLKDGVKVMLIGKKPVAKDDPEMMRLKTVATNLGKEEKVVSDIIYRLDGIHRGFLDDQKKRDTLLQLDRQLKVVTENFTRMLETLDSLQFDEFNKEGRAKRKTYVDRIQTLLDRCDGLLRGVKDIEASMEES
ncbi:BAG family molecular chaperone regulator 1-like [Mizuhopecten yessoensis]|uniref:BAG family molecular chaperone regulator 1 n=1 Tax=Mizuhopecten yessoensis TaxID=6573 RepID=A0A210Q085_MIZYE|nr:BAG family molecular chaperone regulator 1-like [Mizuhopecten yessoensis]OWF42161.1 BAG family molecular chaperone regulator 1 [Mizuhopecten yessoensis]